ncbi:hypothetical protein [Paraclostridium dentum]|uniref:hypothetical protein n=1 Tax=Paraclostridium dentum TaxID=2662455 RepID=UPI003463A627
MISDIVMEVYCAECGYELTVIRDNIKKYTGVQCPGCGEKLLCDFVISTDISTAKKIYEQIEVME